MDLNSNWHHSPLRDLVSFLSKGITPSYAERESETTIRVLNQKCNRNFEINYADSRLHDTAKKRVSPERYVMPEDIIINSTGTGTAGRIAQILEVPCPTTVDGHMIILRSNQKVTQKYLGYALKAHQWEILQLDEGSTGQTELNRERLLDEIIISYPDSEEEQNKIVCILENLDEKLRLNQRINDNLQQQVTALYQMWFEDFLPYGGARPAAWKNAPLSSIASLASGKRPTVISSVKTSDTSIPLVGAASVMGYTNAANHSDKILVIGRVGTLGTVQRFHSPCWTSDNTLTVSSAYYEYTSQILQRIDYTALNRGSTQPLITQGDMNKVEILLPDTPTLEEFEALAGRFMAKYDANTAENAKLSDLRDTLLPRLTSGELDVSKIRL